MVDLAGPAKSAFAAIPLLGGLAMYGGVILAIIFAFDGAAREQSAGIVTGATLVRRSAFWMIAAGCITRSSFCGDAAGGVHSSCERNSCAGVRTVVPERTGYWLDAVLDHFLGGGDHRVVQHTGPHGRAVRGVAATASFFFALLAFLNGQIVVSTLAAAIFGAATAFCAGTSSRRRFSWDDGGAMFLGFLMATLG